MSDHPSPHQPESGGSSNWQPDDTSLEQGPALSLIHLSAIGSPAVGWWL